MTESPFLKAVGCISSQNGLLNTLSANLSCCFQTKRGTSILRCLIWAASKGLVAQTISFLLNCSFLRQFFVQLLLSSATLPAGTKTNI
jgi:hypothetical protein